MKSLKHLDRPTIGLLGSVECNLGPRVVGDSVHWADKQQRRGLVGANVARLAPGQINQNRGLVLCGAREVAADDVGRQGPHGSQPDLHGLVVERVKVRDRELQGLGNWVVDGLLQKSGKGCDSVADRSFVRARRARGRERLEVRVFELGY